MLWIFFAFLAPIFHGITNILDHYLSSRSFKSLWALTFYGTWLHGAFMALILIFDRPAWPTLAMLPAFLLIGVIDVLYPYPYYRALQSGDTSVVAALFALGQILIPIFAFLAVGERLDWVQYCGFILIIVSSAALTLEKSETLRLRLNRAFFYMALCSFLLSVQAVTYKYLFENVDWSTGFLWPTFIAMSLSAGLLLVPRIRGEVRGEFGVFKKNLRLFALEEALAVTGSAASSYAITLAPVTLVKSIDASQPFFVLIYAMIFGRWFPQLFREKIDRHALIQKAIFFAITLVGIVLVVG